MGIGLNFSKNRMLSDNMPLMMVKPMVLGSFKNLTLIKLAMVVISTNIANKVCDVIKGSFLYRY